MTVIKCTQIAKHTNIFVQYFKIFLFVIFLFFRFTMVHRRINGMAHRRT